MEEVVSLEDLLKKLKKRASLIVSLTIISGLIVAIVSFFIITPTYQATTQILVNQKKDNMSQQMTAADIQSSLQLINTYNEIMKSPAILSTVISNLNLSLTTDELALNVSVNHTNNSQVLSIQVQDENYDIAVSIANQIVEVFKEEVPKLMKVDNVNVLSPAVTMENPLPIKPNKILNVIIALIVGLIIGICLASLLEYMDKTVKTERDVEEIIGLPVIGLISPINDELLNEQPPTSSRRHAATKNANRTGRV